MAAAFSVFTKIAGEDALSGLFRNVAGAAKAATAPVTAFNHAVGEPKTTALGRVGSAVDGVTAKFRTGLGSITAWLPALGAIGAAGSLGGLIALTRHASEGYDGLSTAAQKMGASTKDLALWRYGARLANVESEALDKGLVMLNRRMYDAATGKNKDVAALFTAMKVPLRDARGRVLGVTESLGDIAEAFKNTGNASTREAMAIALFGKSGADLIPFLIKGKAGLAELRAEMARFHGLTDEHRHSFEELDKAYKQLDKAGSGLSSRLGAALAPAMIAVVSGTTDWIVANRELLAQSLERKLAAIGRGLAFVRETATTIAAWPVVSSFLQGADAGTAFDFALGALGLTMAGPMLAGVQVITGAIWRMNAALYANPWVLVAAAVAAAAYAIYANWGPIKDWFGEQMSAVSAAFDRGFGSGLFEIFTRFNFVTLLMTAVNGLSKWLFGIDLFDAGKRLLARLIEGLRSLLPDFEAIFGPIERAMSWVGNRWSNGAAALNADTMAAGPVSDFTPAMFAPGAVPTSAPAAPTPPQKADIGVKIDFSNMPKGVQTEVNTSGNADVNTSVGRSMDTAF